ncbi:MAG: hypothetical protein R2693_07605 [Nocardioidaceae bacterium]
MPGSVDELIDLLDLEPIEANLFAVSSQTPCCSGCSVGGVLAEAIMAAIRHRQ